MARFDITGLQYFTDGGELLGGGKLNFYETGTTTRKTTHSDAAMTIANTNPVTLDADGRAPNIFFAGLAKCVLTDADGVIIETKDPVGDDSASSNAFPLWAADVTYAFNQPVTASNAYIYTSLVNNNIGNDPISSPTDWQLIAKTIGIPDDPDGNVLVIDTSAPQKMGSIPQANLKSWVSLGSYTPTATANQDLPDLTGYDQYMIVGNYVKPATAGGRGLYMRMSTDNGATFVSSGYLGQGVYGTNGAVTSTLTGTSEINLSVNGIVDSTNDGISFNIMLYRPSLSSTTQIDWKSVFVGTTGFILTVSGSALLNAASDVDALRFFFDTGNIASGQINVWGLRSS